MNERARHQVYVKCSAPAALDHISRHDIIQAFGGEHLVKDVYRPAGFGNYFFVELITREKALEALEIKSIGGWLVHVEESSKNFLSGAAGGSGKVMSTRIRLPQHELARFGAGARASGPLFVPPPPMVHRSSFGGDSDGGGWGRTTDPRRDSGWGGEGGRYRGRSPSRSRSRSRDRYSERRSRRASSRERHRDRSRDRRDDSYDSRSRRDHGRREEDEEDGHRRRQHRRHRSRSRSPRRRSPSPDDRSRFGSSPPRPRRHRDPSPQARRADDRTPTRPQSQRFTSPQSTTSRQVEMNGDADAVMQVVLDNNDDDEICAEQPEELEERRLRETCSLAVRNLAESCTPETLEAFASQDGLYVCRASAHVYCVGEGVIEYSQPAVATAALATLNGRRVQGQPVRLERI